VAAQKSMELKTALKNAEPPIKNYVTALEAENAKLQRQIAKLEANNVSLQNRINGLEGQLKKHGKVTVQIVRYGDKTLEEKLIDARKRVAKA
jgi:hypothetical protein